MVDFTQFWDERFAGLHTPTDVVAGENILRYIRKKAKDLFIPAGRINTIRHNFPSSAALLADERDHQWSIINGPNQQRLMKTIKGLSKPQKQNRNNTISFNNSAISDPYKCTKKFNAQFTEHPYTNTKLTRALLRQLHHLHLSSLNDH